MKIPTQNLEMLDLSHNLISSLSNNVFPPTRESKSLHNPLSKESTNPEKYTIGNYVNNSYPRLRIIDLHLDFNFIQSLPTGIFRHISVERLSLSNNRITSVFIASDVFDGPMIKELKALDLNYNLIDVYPEALKSLHGIRQLLLKNNRIKSIDDNAFVNCANNLEVLDLSRNLLPNIPSNALSVLKNMIRLNLHDNLISTLDDNDLGDWAISLLSLSLSKNALKSISREALRHAKNLRELRLGGNNILHASSDILLPLRSLELLDLSYALNYVNAGQVIQSVSIGSLHSLKWIQLDYNGLKSTPSLLTFNAMPALMHCDLENNQINEISSDFSGNSNLNLSTIILSRNQLSIIESHTFRDLPHLENIALYLNQIDSIQKYAFKNLTKLKTVILSKNYITHIEKSAFHNLSDSSPSLTVLLDENQLKCFSTDIFSGMGHEKDALKGVLYINVSHNEIRQLSSCSVEGPNKINNNNNNNTVSDDHQPKQTLNIRVLDLSFNLISNIPNQFANTICGALHSLHLNHNKLSSLPIATMHFCTQLQILILDNNLITENINHFNETCSSDLQVLSLRHNKINSLFEFVPIFNQMKNLRVLDLSYNSITILPQNAFLGTKIGRLLLTNNKLRNIEIDYETKLDFENNCFGVKPTLKYFDLSHNYFSSVPIEVMSCENLIELSLTNNLIQELAERSLTKFIRLLVLDLSNNPIKKIGNKSFILSLQNLNTLKLNNISLSTVPILNTPLLTHLELSHNMISSIEPQSIARSRSIRFLDLSKNLLQDVPRYLWRYTTKLQVLQIQYNPIDVLDTSSFSDLQNLRQLDIRGLSLQYIDTRLLHTHR
jgi:Leucine-rich repeat (LRR) protein